MPLGILFDGAIMKNEYYIKEISNNIKTSEKELEKERKNKHKDYEIANHCLIAKIKFLREKLIILKK